MTARKPGRKPGEPVRGTRTVTIGKRLRVCVYLPGGALVETTLTARLLRTVAAA